MAAAAAAEDEGVNSSRGNIRAHERETACRIACFVNDYLAWEALRVALDREEAEPEGRLLLLEGLELARAQDRGVRARLHSLNAGGMNDREGEVSGYLALRDRFAIRLEGSGDEFAVRAKNILMLSPSDTADEQQPHSESSSLSSSSSSSSSSLERTLLQPGALFRGTIQIPGDAGFENRNGERQEYSLHVVEVKEDDLGRPTVLARHRAYGDEQYVVITSRQDEEEAVEGGGGGGGAAEQSEGTAPASSSSSSSSSLAIEYCDGETHCRGRWVVSGGAQALGQSSSALFRAGRFEGSVSQILHGSGLEDNVYHKSDTITHTFSLEKDTLSLGALVHPSGAALVADRALVALDKVRALLETSRARLVGQFSPFLKAATKDLWKITPDTEVMTVADYLAAPDSFAEDGGGGGGSESSSDGDRSSGSADGGIGSGSGSGGGSSSMGSSSSMGNSSMGSMGSGGSGSTYYQRKFDWRAVRWGELMEGAGLLGEKVCARFRERAALLDGLAFEDEAHRRRLLGRLEERAGAAEEEEQWLQHRRGKVPGWRRHGDAPPFEPEPVIMTGIGSDKEHGEVVEVAGRRYRVRGQPPRGSLAAQGARRVVAVEAPKEREVGDAAGGISLRAAHREWDTCMMAGQNIYHAARQLTPHVTEEGQQRLFSLLMTMNHRLEANYRRLDDALARARSRLTQRTIKKWKSPPPPPQTASAAAGAAAAAAAAAASSSSSCDDEVCAICYLPIASAGRGENAKEADMEEDDDENDDGPALYLPCRHTFHSGCIRTWLHNHSQCPMCRFDLTEEEEEGQQARSQPAEGKDGQGFS